MYSPRRPRACRCLRTTAAGSLGLLGVAVWWTMIFCDDGVVVRCAASQSASFAPHCARVTIGGAGQFGFGDDALGAIAQVDRRGAPLRRAECGATATAAPAPAARRSSGRRFRR